MRLLIQGLNYAPDEIGIPKYTTEMAEWLVGRGWDVSVVTAAPYYPRWTVPAGYSARRYTRDERNGVSVLRCPFYVPARPTGTRRMIHLASFAASSAPALAWEARRFKPDAILSVAPALMAACAGSLVAKAIRRPSLLHVQDFELDIAFGLGLLRGQAIQRALMRVERAVYRGFDLVSAPSGAMTARLVEKGCAPERVFELRNWADTEAIRPDVSGADIRREIAIGSNDVVALYSGNLSEKQGASLLVEAARLLKPEATIRLVICGDGPAREAIARGVSDLGNVTLLPLQPKERLPALLCAADIHLLPQLASADGLVLPSKLSGMLSSGRPVVATVTPRSGVGREIGGGGVIVPPGDAGALAEAIRLLARDPAGRAEMGREGRLRAEASWAKNEILAGLEGRLRDLVGRARRRSGEVAHPAA